MSSRSSKSTARAASRVCRIPFRDPGEGLRAKGLLAHLVRRSLRETPRILPRRDAREDPPRGVELLREVESPKRFAHRRHLIVLVVDDEARGEADGRRLATQDAHAEGVEGRDPARERSPAQEGLGARLHLPRRLVGEGDGQHLVGRHAEVQHEVGDPVGDDPGLAAARPREDQHGALHGPDRLLLLGVQPLEQGAPLRHARTTRR